MKTSTVAYWVAQYRLMGICPMAEGPTEVTPTPAPANAEQVSVPAVPPSPKPNSAAHKKAYKQAYKLAGEMYHRKSASAGTVQQRLQQKFGLTLSKSTVHRAAQRKVGSPKKKGQQCILHKDLEDEVLHFIGRLNANNLPVLRDRIIAMVNHLLTGQPEVTQRFKGNKVGEKWWYPPLKNNKSSLRMCNIITIQTDRLKWSTPENVKAWYDIVKERALSRGRAVVHPDYSVSEPDSPEILWKHPDRVMSCDETGLTMDMTDNKKDRANKSVTVRGRKCEVIAQKSPYRFPAIGGSTASAQSLPPMLIFPGTSSTLGQAMGGPKSSTGFPATIHHNGTGGATSADDTMLRFVQQNILPNVVPKPSETLPVILILDGHGSRMTVPLLGLCREHHIIIILRPPHTTHITQPEDAHNFAKLKVLWRKEKFGLLSHRAVGGNWGVSASLSPANAMSCLKKPWEAAFDPQVNAAGWRATVLAPFTRRIEKTLLAEVGDRAIAGDLLVHPSVQEVGR